MIYADTAPYFMPFQILVQQNVVYEIILQKNPFYSGVNIFLKKTYKNPCICVYLYTVESPLSAMLLNVGWYRWLIFIH